MKVKLLFDYLTSRSEYEDVDIFDLNIEYLEQLFFNGHREFYGVHVNDHGFPLWDENEPYSGALNNQLFRLLKIDEDTKNEPGIVFTKYMPTEKDYKYFIDLYGVNGSQKNTHLQNITFSEFRWAGFFFQLKSGTPWTLFGHGQCQMVRDQLLVMLRKEPIGFVQLEENRFMGIEHLIPH